MAFTVNKKGFCVLEFAKIESIVTVQRRFRIIYHTEPPTDKTIQPMGLDGLFVSQRTGSHSAGIHVPFTNCFVCRWFCVVHDPKPVVVVVATVIAAEIQGSSNMTRTDVCVNKCKQSRSYFIFIVPCIVIFYGITNRCHNVQ